VLEFASPAWLIVAASAAALIWWLHRRGEAETSRTVPAAFLFDAAAEGAAARVSPRRDPHWRLRAAIAAAVCLAASGPEWIAHAPAPVVVWVDDSASLAAIDGGARRADALAARLAEEIARAGIAEAELRSLRVPGRALALASPDAVRIARWIAPIVDPPISPASRGEVPARAEWLATDGADTRIAPWAEAVRPLRVIQAGSETENVAVTAIVLRRAVDDPRLFDGYVEVANAGNGASSRVVTLRDDTGVEHLRAHPVLAAGEIVRLKLRLEATAARLTARLDLADTLATDDALEATVAELRPLATYIDGACGTALRAAIAAHPGLRLVAGAAPPGGLRIACGRDAEGTAGLHLRTGGAAAALAGPPAWRASAGLLRDVRLDPKWLRAFADVREVGGEVLLADASRPLISQAGGRVVVDLDLDHAALVELPAFPALVAGLVDRAAGRPVLDAMVRAERPIAAASIAPRRIADPGLAPPQIRQPNALAAIVLIIALVLLALDLALILRARA
jgi:hypothetical protein